MTLTRGVPAGRTVHFTDTITTVGYARPNNQTNVPGHRRARSFLSLCTWGNGRLPEENGKMFVDVVRIANGPHRSRLIRLVTRHNCVGVRRLTRLLSISARAIHQSVQGLDRRNLVAHRRKKTKHISDIVGATFRRQRLSLATRGQTVTRTITSCLPRHYAIFVAVNAAMRTITETLLGQHSLHVVAGDLHITRVLCGGRSVRIVIPKNALHTRGNKVVNPKTISFVRNFHTSCLVADVNTVRRSNALLRFSMGRTLITEAVVGRTQGALLITSRAGFTTSTTISVNGTQGIETFFASTPPPGSFYRLLDRRGIRLIITRRRIS